jgi:hypothetical protein
VDEKNVCEQTNPERELQTSFNVDNKRSHRMKNLLALLSVISLSGAMAACSSSGMASANSSGSGRMSMQRNLDNPRSLTNNQGDFYHFRDAEAFERAQESTASER